MTFMPNFLAVTKWPGLVQHDREEQGENEDERRRAGSSSGGLSPPTGRVHRTGRGGPACRVSSRARSRAQRSAASTSASAPVSPRAAVMLRDYLRDGVDDAGERRAGPPGTPPTHTSFAAL